MRQKHKNQRREMSILNMAAGVLGMLGRSRTARPANEREEEDEVPVGSVARPGGGGYAVPVSRADSIDDDAVRQLDATMNYSPDPRTGRIPKGIYAGKTPAEARLAARRNVENQRRGIGGGDVGRIGTDRSDYTGAPGAGKPMDRASAGLDKHNAAVKAAQARGVARAGGDMRGVSVWRNNGDGSATSGRFGADNTFKGERRDIVPRLSPGQVAVSKPGQPVPKGADAGTHMVYEGKPDGSTAAKAMPTITPKGTITVFAKDGMRSWNANDPTPTNAPLVTKAPPPAAAPVPAPQVASVAGDEEKKPGWARPFRAGPRARA